MAVAELDVRAFWPPSLKQAPSNHLEFDGCDLRSLAAERGTPLWVVSHSTIEQNYHDLLSAFRARWRRCEIAYSMKANNLLAVIRVLNGLGAPIDASAEHEFQLALLAGVSPAEIILNGNGKSDDALRTAAQLGARQVNVDSLDEVRRLNRIAAELGTQVRCVVRIQLTYARLLSRDPSFESTLRIGEGKFGSNIATGQAAETAEAVINAANLEFCGLSHHVGFSGYMADYSAEREVMHHAECAREVCEFANDLRRRTGAIVDRLDLGGGFRGGGCVMLATPGAGDPQAHALPTAADYAEAIFPSVEEVLEVDDPPLLQFESGGHQIGNAVVLLATVNEIKDVPSAQPRRYVVVDASMMMFVSRGMMRVGTPVVRVANPLERPDDISVDVVGQTCVYDSIAEDVRLPGLTPGDIVAILHQGAYCETQSTQFNAFPRPEVVLARRGAFDIIRRRESLGDIAQRDRIPIGLWAPSP